MFVLRIRYWVLFVIILSGLFIALIAAAVTSLEGGSQTALFEPAQGTSYDNSNREFSEQPPPPPSNESGVDVLTSGNSQTTQQRIILRDATVSIVVEDVTAKVDAIRSMALEMGGWVVNQNSNTSSYGEDEAYTSAQIEVRVPSDQLETALQQIQDGVVRVTSESITGQDVTDDYVDLSSRLTNLQAAETQLQALMSQADTVDQVLSVFNQLTTTRGDIEVIQGRLRYYDQSAAFSSITVYLQPKPDPVVETDTEKSGWRPGDTFDDAVAALGDVAQLFADAFIWLAVFAVILVPLLIVLGFVWRWLGRKPKSTPEAPTSNPE